MDFKQTEDKVLDIINEILGNNAIISIMSQYTPITQLENKHPEINRKITNLEYKVVTNYAIKLGLKNAFIQELESASQEYTPTFDRKIIDIKIHQN